MVEKPLGRDLESSQQINDEIASHFAESQIFRIDHYLGKETVQNLLAIRFGNILFEPLWRNSLISNVQITVAETVGMEGGRGSFYDQTGALRDMMQNHVLQLLGIIAMEPPSSIDSNAIRDEKVKVLRALRPITGKTVDEKAVRGQYTAGKLGGEPVNAYLNEDGVDPDSHTETYCAMVAEIDNWRWRGTPFFLRTGKRLARRETGIVINFRGVPHSIFTPNDTGNIATNRMLIRLQPQESIEVSVFNKVPGNDMRLTPLDLSLDLQQAQKIRTRIAYERLIMDCVHGNPTLFIRRDEQEAAWRWIDPIRAHWDAQTARPAPYYAGDWGPSAADELIGKYNAEWFYQTDD
jgi:glucose-6-phosphate 1-dehydrogenase